MCDYCQSILTQICSKCNKTKPLTCNNFSWRNDNKKFRADCKECINYLKREKNKTQEQKDYMKNYNTKYYIKNCEMVKENQRKRNRENPDYMKNYMKLHYDPIKQKEYDLKKGYGITIENYNSLLIKQKFKCPISNIPIIFPFAHVDHNHITGKIRGLLHANINIGLGLFHENIPYMENSIKYLNISTFNEINNIIRLNKPLFNKTKSDWNNFERKKHSDLKCLYKISLWDYYDILKLQNYKCPVSNIEHNEEYKLVVDHCHKTGQIRGLINGSINSALGCFKDDPGIIKNGIKYLISSE